MKDTFFKRQVRFQTLSFKYHHIAISTINGIGAGYPVIRINWNSPSSRLRVEKREKGGEEKTSTVNLHILPDISEGGRKKKMTIAIFLLLENITYAVNVSRWSFLLHFVEVYFSGKTPRHRVTRAFLPFQREKEYATSLFSTQRNEDYPSHFGNHRANSSTL